MRSAFLQSVYYFVHLQEFANFKESSGKREKCLSRVRGLLEAGVRGGEVQERAGTGRDWLGGLFCQLGIKGMKQMSPGLTRQAGGSGESLKVQDQGQVAGKI